MEPTRLQWAAGFMVVLGIAIFAVGLLEFRPYVGFFVVGGWVLAGLGVPLFIGEMRRLRNIHRF